MLAFTVRKFCNNGFTIPNLDEDDFRIVDHTSTNDYGRKRGSYEIQAWNYDEEDWRLLIRINCAGWCEGFDSDLAKDLGLIVNGSYAETGIMDGLYYLSNPIEFKHKNGNLKRGFEHNLAKRLVGRSKTSGQTNKMLQFYKEYVAQETNLEGQALFNAIKARLGGTCDLFCCPLSKQIEPTYKGRNILFNNNHMKVLANLTLSAYGLQAVSGYSNTFVSDDYIFWRDRAYLRSELTLIRCPCCNNEVPDETIDQEEQACEACVENRYKIHSYSTRVPTLLSFKAKNVKPNVDPVYLGIEIEYETSDRQVAAKKVGKALAGHAIMKSDGSIRNGFEVVTCPATMDIHLEIFKTFYENKPPEIFSAANVGMHVHVSRKPLNMFTIGKMVEFLNRTDNKEFVGFIAGRIDNQYARVNSSKTVTSPLYHDGNRYSALNLCPQETVEFRIFSTPVNFMEFASRLEFVQALIEYCSPAKLSLPLKEQTYFKNFIQWLVPNHKSYPELYATIKGAY